MFLILMFMFFSTNLSKKVKRKLLHPIQESYQFQYEVIRLAPFDDYCLSTYGNQGMPIQMVQCDLNTYTQQWKLLRITLIKGQKYVSFYNHGKAENLSTVHRKGNKLLTTSKPNPQLRTQMFSIKKTSGNRFNIVSWSGLCLTTRLYKGSFVVFLDNCIKKVGMFKEFIMNKSLRSN